MSASQSRTSPSQPPAAASLPSSEIAAAYCHSTGPASWRIGRARHPIPEPDGPIAAGRDQPPAVAAEGELLHRPRMPAPPRRRLVAVKVPPAQLRLVARRHEPLPIRVHGHGEHVFIVAAVGALFLQCPDVDPLDRFGPCRRS